MDKKFILAAIVIGLFGIVVASSMLWNTESNQLEKEERSSSTWSSGNASGFWWPIGERENGEMFPSSISSGYGWRTVYGKRGFHEAIDIQRDAYDKLPNIVASYPGEIVIKDFMGGGYGNYIKIKHDVNGETWYTLYGHMSEFADGIEVGTTVLAGQVIGVMGETGYATGPHLHFEIRDADENKANPVEKNAGHPYVDHDNPRPTNSEGNSTSEFGVEGDIKDANIELRTLMLVNEWNRLPDGWVPTGLVTQNGYKMLSEVATAYQNMCKDYGSTISLCSAYRTEQWQRDTKSQHETNPLYAHHYGTEHRTGLALDFVSATNWSSWISSNPNLWKWLCNNAMNYGFILRYPNGTYSTTGVGAESWHWRYIGEERAKDFYEAAKATGKSQVDTGGTYYLYTYEEYFRDYVSKNTTYAKTKQKLDFKEKQIEDR